MDALRKVYHRAVQIPLDNVECLWQELEAFETKLNRITAKKFMADLSPAHMQARTVLHQLVNHVGAIYPPNTPEIFLPSLPRFDASERALVGKWKAYLKWEEGNPLEIEEKDRATLITRIKGVYRKAVIRMRYYTEIWYRIYCRLPLVLLTVHLSSGSWLTPGRTALEGTTRPCLS
jgi:cleavage stimulation factor subunit 3